MILILAACFAAGCNNAGSPVAQTHTAATPANSDPRSQTAVAHTTESKTGADPSANGAKSRWTQGGDPVDTAKFDAAIDAAEKAHAAKANDATTTALAKAYLDRANALTEARQYAAALGDYRRTLKHDPANEEAKEWIEQIVSIYTSMGRDYPKEGQEPAPLPFSKAK